MASVGRVSTFMETRTFVFVLLTIAHKHVHVKDSSQNMLQYFGRLRHHATIIQHTYIYIYIYIHIYIYINKNIYIYIYTYGDFSFVAFNMGW